eukprot:scaffold284853_cov24-Prasinocladus_malaysianus.AAC.1
MQTHSFCNIFYIRSFGLNTRSRIALSLCHFLLLDHVQNARQTKEYTSQLAEERQKRAEAEYTAQTKDAEAKNVRNESRRVARELATTKAEMAKVQARVDELSLRLANAVERVSQTLNPG